jgi:CBS domain-containing protein
MLEHDCGLIPVVDERGSKRLVGVVTDRDLTCRGLARGLGPEATVADVMSREVGSCEPDADAQDVQRVMTDRQVRRVPIVDGDGAVVGIVAQADLARAAKRDLVSDRAVGKVLEEVSEPSRNTRVDAESARADLRF